MAELEFKLDGSTVKCRTGFGVIIAATEYLKEQRKQEYRESRDLLAEGGNSQIIQEEITKLTSEFLKKQTPTTEEVYDWLQTTVGIRFFLKHGTKDGPKKLNDESTERLLDQMSEADFTSLVETIAELCYGKENYKNMRNLAEQKISLERQRQEKMLEVAQMELDVLSSVKDRMATKLSSGELDSLISGGGAE